MVDVDISNPDLLRNIDPIRKAVYDEGASPTFNIGHLNEPPPTDLYGWADAERGGKASYEMVQQSDADGMEEKWELDVKPLISSTKWLGVHGLKRNRLSMNQILTQIGFKHTEEYVETLGRPVGSYYGQGLFQQFKRKDGQLYNVTVGRPKLLQVGESLLKSSHLFKRRLQWLSTGSRKIFGVIQEHCICIVIDVTTMSQTQFDLYRESLCQVIKDQVSQLAKFNMIKAQADMQMWQEQATPVTEVTLQSAIEWIWQLDRMAETSRTACAEAIIKSVEDESLESVYLFAEGDACESSKEILRQKLTSSEHVLHTVSFNATKTSTIKFLKEIAQGCNGRFHAFVVKSIYETDAEAYPRSAAPPGGDAARISVRLAQRAKGGVPAGAGVREDVFKIWAELEECRNNHAQIQTLLTEIPETQSENSIIDRPAITDGGASEQYMSSKNWLKRHGLDVKKLTAFQALASCSFKHVDGVVNLKGKPGPNNNHSSDADNMRKLVNAKYCENFAHTKWKDGSIVHVHITAEQHKMYERKMNTTLNAIQQRVDWLQQGSREVFGTILEEQVYILIDTSQSMREKLSLVKEKLFQLMQEQLRHKSKFNVVKFDTKAVAWKDRVVDVNEQNLLNAWSWIKDIGVGGSTNTLAALRIALADPHTHAIYILSDGRPDQQPRSILAQVQLQHPVPIHTIAFNCYDNEANKFLHQLSSDTGGRYHNFSTDGALPDSPPPFESEDVSLLKKEIERGKADLEKVSKLRARCVMLDWYHNKSIKQKELDHQSPSSKRSSRLTSRSSTSQALTLHHSERAQSVCSTSSDDSSGNEDRRPHTSQGFYRSTPSLHQNHRGQGGVNDEVILKRRNKKRNKQGYRKGHHAGHTRTSVLRLGGQGDPELRGWMLPESRDFMQRQIDHSMEAYQDLARLKLQKNGPRKPAKTFVNTLDVPNYKWLKRYGLVARRLTVMDVLSPTVVRVSPKYVPVLDSYVVSKVFNEVLPIAHVSPRCKQAVRLVNPAAVDLNGYEKRLVSAIDEYKNRLDMIVWRNLTQEEREKFGEGPISYFENQTAIHQAFDRLNWPFPQGDLQLLVDEIHQGQRYLQQSKDLTDASKQVAMGRKKDTTDEDTHRSYKSSKGKKSKSRRKSREKDDSCIDNDETSSSSNSNSDSEKSNNHEKEVKERKIPTSDSEESSSCNYVDDTLANKKSKPKIDRLKGQKVIARFEVNGYYYPGVVVKSINVRKVVVSFDFGAEEVIPTRYIIQMSGAVSCPTLKVGDYVLVLCGKKHPRYEPGQVLGDARLSKSHYNKHIVILKPDGTRATVRRKKLIKISETLYKFDTRYIEQAKKIDPTVPPVHFEQPVELGVSKDDINDIKDQLDDVQIQLDVQYKQQKHQADLIHKSLDKNLQGKDEIKNLCHESKKEIIQNQEKNSKLVEKVMKEISTQTKDEITTYNTACTNVIADHIAASTENVVKELDTKMDKMEMTTLKETPTQTEPIIIPKQPDPEPVLSPEEELIEPNNPTVVSLSRDNSAVTITKDDKGVHISQRPSPYTILNEEVLSRCDQDGWYYRGTVESENSNGTYAVKDTTDYIQDTHRDHIITDKDDERSVVKEQDYVIAERPDYSLAYAPAKVNANLKDGFYGVVFYDDLSASVSREELYKIQPQKYKDTVSYIEECENKWVGEAVVARSDIDGMYHLGSCRDKLGAKRVYHVQFADGSYGLQHLSCLFGANTRKRSFKSGDYVLAICDERTLDYLPGRVVSVDGHKMSVEFCNRARLNSVEPDHCFWISRQYYDLSVSFYLSQQGYEKN